MASPRGAAFCLLIITGCAARHASDAFRVVPASPEYLLRSPDQREIPFAEVLTSYNGFTLGSNWVNLRPRMELRVENAYYKAGAPKHGLDGFLGTEIARYRVTGGGSLRLVSVRSELKRRPLDQPPVQALIGDAQNDYRFHRFFRAIVFKRRGSPRGSVLIGAKSAGELDRLGTELLTNPDAVCNGSPRCTVFPEACSVALEMQIVVNGAARSVLWASPLSSVAEKPHFVALRRFYNGRLIPVEVDPSDPSALRLPLLPGDHINWN